MSDKGSPMVCDFCQCPTDANNIFSTRKSFAGTKVCDILQSVTQRTIPLSTDIKLCCMCASTLHTTTGNIQRAIAMVEKCFGKGHKPPKERHDSNASVKASNGNIATEPAKKTAPKSPVKQPSAKKAVIKTPAQSQSFLNILDESLKDAVKLTPSNVKEKPKKTFLRLFGNNNTSKAYGSDIESDDDEEEASEDEEDSAAVDFECKVCDFKTQSSKKMKAHYSDKHGQTRARIFNCLKCPKSFGVLKSLTKHLDVTHGISKAKKPEEPELMPRLSKITALKRTPVAKDDYTFAVPDTNSSTPKPAEGKEVRSALIVPRKHHCESCSEDFRTIKGMQDHMRTVHQVDRPKIFKCDLCGNNFASAKTFKRHHMIKHNLNEQDQAKVKKTPARRKTIDFRPLDVEITAPQKPRTPQRRKTIDVSLLQAEENKESSCKLDAIHVVEELDVEEVKEEIPNGINSFETPNKNKSKVNISVVEVATTTTPSKKTKGKEVVETPGKYGKEVSKVENISEEELPIIVNGSPRKSKESKKSAKRKASDEESVVKVEEKQYKKKAKVTEADELQEVIELLDEVNMNPMPHKRLMLEPVMDSSPESQTSLNCNQCDKVVSSRKRLDSHIRKMHGLKLQCPQCSSVFKSSDAYLNHFNNCDSSGPLSCGIPNCKKSFKDAAFLRSHLSKKHKI